MIDPALQEQIAFGRPEDETEAVMLLQPGHDPPPPARLVARFGDVVTCRLDVNDIVEVRSHPWVLALKASRIYGGTEFVAGEPELPAVPGATVRRGPWNATGRGVIVAVLDWGCDFAHPNFRRDDGRTRLLALWDQRRPARAGNRYGYGTIYRSHEIDRALFSADPYAALGYHPAEADPSKRGTHGCHVMDIAAGNGRLRGSAVGVACDAHLIFVHLAARITPPLQDLGDCVRVLEAIDFVRQTAGFQPWVVNMSLGRTGGDHTGCSLVERAIDSVLEEWPGRACVLSAGNYFARNLHAEGLLRPGGQAVLEWRIEPDDDTPNELEVWYSGRDRYVVRLVSPAGAVFAAGLDEKRSVVLDGLEVGRLYHRAKDSASGDHHVDLFLDPGAPAGSWQVILEGVDVVDGRYHAWIERDVSRAGQSTFAPEQSSSRSTIGTIANGYRTLVVGAYDPATGEPAGFSSAGPTRDGRYKPDITAPGKDILAARSTPRGLAPGQGGLVSMSGTSMAAPHVAGAVALLFEAVGRPLHIEETRALLLGHASACEEECDPARVGAGRLDMDRALAAVAGRLPDDLPAAHKGGAIAMPTSDATFWTLEEIERAADRLYDEAIAGSMGRLSGVQVVALPGQRVPAPLLGSGGDLVLLRVALGEPGLGYAATLAGTELATSQQLAVQGVAVEEGPPGGYAVVVEAGTRSGPPRARQITDASGVLATGQVLLRVEQASPRLEGGVQEAGSWAFPDETPGGGDGAEDESRASAAVEWGKLPDDLQAKIAQDVWQRLGQAHRRTLVATYLRFKELGVWDQVTRIVGVHESPAAPIRVPLVGTVDLPGRTAALAYEAKDGRALVKALVLSRQFAVDGKWANYFHSNQTGLREWSGGASFHVSVGPGDTFDVHIDRISQQTSKPQESGRATIDPQRAASHLAREVLPQILRDHGLPPLIFSTSFFPADKKGAIVGGLGGQITVGIEMRGPADRPRPPLQQSGPPAGDPVPPATLKRILDTVSQVTTPEELVSLHRPVSSFATPAVVAEGIAHRIMAAARTGEARIRVDLGATYKDLDPAERKRVLGVVDRIGTAVHGAMTAAHKADASTAPDVSGVTSITVTLGAPTQGETFTLSKGSPAAESDEAEPEAVAEIELTEVEAPRLGAMTVTGPAPDADEDLTDAEFDPAAVPTNVADALAKKDWPLALSLAIQAGWHDENELANLIFFTRHPELPNQSLDRKHPKYTQLSGEWTAILRSEVRPAIHTASEDASLKVSGRYVAERDPQFSGETGRRFKELVDWAAKEVDIPPGLLAAVLLAEWDDRSLYLGSAAVSSFVSGTDDFFAQRGQLAKNVPAVSKVRFDPSQNTTNVNEHGRTVITTQFKSGKDATLATAVYLKYAEIKLRKAAEKNGGDFDALARETRFALVRIAMGAGHGGISPAGELIRFKKKLGNWVPVTKGESGGVLFGVASSLDRVLKGEDILVRTDEARTDPTNSGRATHRNATILAAQAMHLSDWFFDVPAPAPAAQPELESLEGFDEAGFGLDDYEDDEFDPSIGPFAEQAFGPQLVQSAARSKDLVEALAEVKMLLNPPEHARLGKVAFAIARLGTGNNPVEFAGLRAGDMHFSGSLLKLTLLYASFQLAARVNALAPTIAANDAASFFAEVDRAFSTRIAAAVPSIPAGEWRRVRFKEVLAATRGADGIFTVALSARHRADLERTVSDQNQNASATACIRRLGYSYINGALAAGGFFDSNTKEKLWLANDFGGGWPQFHVPVATGGTSSVAMTAVGMLLMVSAMHAGTLVDPSSSREMLDMFSKGGSWLSLTPNPRAFSLTTRAAKVGHGASADAKVGAVKSEATIVELDGVPFAVVWQNYPDAVPNVTSDVVHVYSAIERLLQRWP